jgi:eukaryotic-like serine/threonine-protein kinase
MQPHHHQDADMIQRFKQEAKAVSSLSHPNVVTLHDYGVTEEGFLFFVMDYLKGTNLAQRIRAEKCLPLTTSLKIFVQMCRALDHAHSLRIVHRDLKPSNIMLLEEDVENFVKIVDFGIAKLVTQNNDIDEHRITKSGEIFGSPMYMSPEHCMGRPLDARSDIYSLGCVMYETLTGQPPFVGLTAYEIFFKQMNTSPAPMEISGPPSLCEAIERVVFACLDRDENRRFQSMTLLREALEKLAEQIERVI